MVNCYAPQQLIIFSSSAQNEKESNKCKVSLGSVYFCCSNFMQIYEDCPLVGCVIVTFIVYGSEILK